MNVISTVNKSSSQEPSSSSSLFYDSSVYRSSAVTPFSIVNVLKLPIENENISFTSVTIEK
jgi:hypothetical protein